MMLLPRGADRSSPQGPTPFDVKTHAARRVGGNPGSGAWPGVRGHRGGGGVRGLYVCSRTVRKGRTRRTAGP